MSKNIKINIKGTNGSGKTIISIMIALILKRYEKDTLLVDCQNEDISKILEDYKEDKIEIKDFKEYLKSFSQYKYIVLDNPKITNKEDINIYVSESNLIEIIKLRKIIQRDYKVNKKYIILNKLNENSISNEIVSSVFPEILKIYELKNESKVNAFINNSGNVNLKRINKVLNEIVQKIIIKNK